MRMAAPRLLPATTVALAALLGMKGLELVRAATPADALGQTSTKPVAASTPVPAGASSASAPAAPPASTPRSSAAPSAAATPAAADGEKTVLQELRQRRQQLDARERAVAAREAILAAAEHKLNQRIVELEALQKHLEALEAARQQRQDASWAGLVKLYSSMQPRDAAKIFNDLDTPVLLEVVDRMNERKAAPILAAMQPDRAREVTEKLAALRTRRDSAAGN